MAFGPREEAFAFGLALSCIAIAAPALAEEASDTNSSSVSDQGQSLDAIYLSTLSLEELLNVKVTVASKTEESSASAPSSVTVFTREEIERYGFTTLDELLNFVPGFQATREVEQGTTTRVGVRGHSTALGESILVLRNGQRLNDLYTGGAFNINRLISLNEADRVEIIRGPGSAIYGSNAFVGVVNIVTRVDVPSELSAGIGNSNSRAFSASLSEKLFDDKLSVTGFAQGFSDNGQNYQAVTDKYGVTGDTRDPAAGLDFALVAQYKNLTLQARHMERKLEDFLAWGVLQRNWGNSHEGTKQSSVNLAATFKPTEKLHIDAALGVSLDQLQAVSVQIPKGASLGDGSVQPLTVFGGPYIESYHLTPSLEARYHLAKSERLSNDLAFGISYEQAAITEIASLMNINQRTQRNIGEILEQTDPELVFNEKKTRHVVGAYVEDKQELGEFFQITGGLRYDYYSDFGSALSPRLAGVVFLPFDAQAKLLYGQAFRAPTYLELYDKNQPNYFGNHDLNAETISTYEAVYSQTIEGRLQATLSYFYSQMRDVIVFGVEDDDPANTFGAPGFVNKGQEDFSGLELELKATPVKDVLLSGSLTHLVEGTSTMMPSTFGSLAVAYQIGDLSLRATGVFRQRLKALPNQDAYCLLNVGATYALFHALDLRIDAKNLLNERYWTPSSVAELRDGVPNRGLMLMAGFSYYL